MAVPGDDGAKTTQWSRVMLLIGAAVFSAFQIGKAPPVLPVIKDELGLNMFMAGLIISAFNLVGAGISMTAGAFADWAGHRRLLLAGLLCQAAASLAGSQAETSGFLLATRFVEGLGYILIVVSAPSLIMRLVHPGQARLVFGFWSCFMPVGGAVMMVAASPLADCYGWRGLWLINSGLLFLMALSLAAWTRGLTATGSGGEFSPRRMIGDAVLVIKARAPLLLAFCFGTYTFQFLAVIGFLPTMLIEHDGLAPSAAAALSALALLSNVIGNLLGGRLLQKGRPRRRLTALASLVMGLSAFGIYSEHLSLTARFFWCLAFIGVGGMLPTAVFEGAAARAPKPSLIGLSNGLLMQGAQIGLLLGPPLLAVVVDNGRNWDKAPWLLAAAAILGLVASAALGWEDRKHDHDNSLKIP